MGGEHSNNKAITTKEVKTKEAAPIPDALNLKKYNKISVIGRGGFGRVTSGRFRSGKYKARNKGNSML